jgi:hypothetical protein
MKWLIKTIGFAALLPLTIVLQSCMTGIQLRATPVDQTPITGTYTLLLHGCHYLDQIDNVAILVDENSRYPLEIYDIDTSFTVKKGVPAQRAVAEADAFVRCSSHRVWRTRVSRIPDDSGGTVGYEVRPLYTIPEFGTPDILTISYSLRNGKIRAYIRKFHEADDLPGFDRDNHGSGGHH